MKKSRLINLNNTNRFLYFLKRGGDFIPLFVLVFILTSCGIAVPYYLNPPTYFTNLNFYNAYINDPNFARGYEFYYRIYDDNTLTRDTAINDASAFFNETTLLALIGNIRPLFEKSYYRRISPVSDDIATVYSDPALIPYNPVLAPIMRVDPVYFDKTDSSKNFQININILGTTNVGYLSTTADYNPSSSYPKSITFKRYITVDGNNFTQEVFNNFSILQDDVPDTITDGKGSIAFFVVLYGLTDQFVSVFSDVVYIGTESIDITSDNITTN